MNIAFVDTETTGLNPTLNPIWEIAVIVDDVEHCWQVRLPDDMPLVGDDDPKPSTPYMTKWAFEHTGWRDRYDDDLALSPLAAVERFCELVDGRHLVGAVPSFDEERLRSMYHKYVDHAPTRYPWHYHLIDVEALTVGYLAGIGHRVTLPWKSHELSERIGVMVPVEDEHTALGDARWAKAVYEAVIGSAS